MCNSSEFSRSIFMIFMLLYGFAGNTAFIASLAADAGLKTTEYQNFAKSQINYMLGDGGRSYVIGFGKNPPNAPHHRSR